MFLLRNIIVEILVLILFISNSCKSEFEKIDLNDVESHRAYQDSAYLQCKNQQEKMEVTKKLISEYRKIANGITDENSNYNYYLARLYGKIVAFPLKGFWIDTINNSFLNEAIYSNICDSALFYSEKSLELDKDNVRSMFNFCVVFYFDLQNFMYNSKIVPWTYNRSKIVWNKRSDYILNNALRFSSLDTTKDKYLSRGICEVAINLIGFVLESRESAMSNEEKVDMYYAYGQIWDYIKDTDPVIIKFNKSFINTNIYPKILNSRSAIKNREIREQKMKNIRTYGTQYIGTWQADEMNSKLIIKDDGTYEIFYYSLGGSTGKGTWDCTANSISFKKISGEHVAFMFEEVYHSNTAILEYANIFAPTLCLKSPNGHVDFCFSHFNQ